MDFTFALGLTGTITGIISLCIVVWNTMQEKPIVKIGDAMILLGKRDDDKAIGKLSFNVDNIGDRSTTVSRVNVIFGDDVQVFESLRTLASHSSIRYPEKTDSEIQLLTSLRELDNLKIIVKHTHKTIAETYSIPQVSEWEKRALFKGGPMALEL